MMVTLKKKKQNNLNKKIFEVYLIKRMKNYYKNEYINLFIL